MTATGHLYDGVTGVRREALVRRDGDALHIEARGIEPERVPLALLRHAGQRSTADIWSRTDRVGWRLTLIDAPAELCDALPGRDGFEARLDRISLPAAVAAGAVALAIVATVALKFVDWVTPLVPDPLADRIGAEAVTLLGRPGQCTGADGQAALDRLVARLQPGKPPIRVHVIDSPTINAFAVPGRHIGVLRGLINEVKTPDELAGVLAHEVAHVEGKHPLKGVIRAGALAFVLQNVGGDAASIAQTALLLTYTRGAETEADAKAIVGLKRIGVSPKPLADFLSYIGDHDGQDLQEQGNWRVVLRYASTHPLTGDRRRMLLGAVEPGRAYAPAMTAAEWSAVQSMCEPRR
ncbi:M48 family metallopeptidase [Sphingoaurantiacus capsulatus]|uniref:M48 family metallopeptidase n=1 Tax=Sphingoaurantiacus capsulatus TaxID=1771310 RepID=A0ABV7X8B5_9SPHN